MDIGWREQKAQWQARTPAQEGMHPIATQEWARVVGRGMSNLCIGVMPAPGEDGCTIDDEIAGADEPTPEGNLHHHDQ